MKQWAGGDLGGKRKGRIQGDRGCRRRKSTKEMRVEGEHEKAASELAGIYDPPFCPSSILPRLAAIFCSSAGCIKLR